MGTKSLEARVRISLASIFPEAILERSWILHGGISATTTAFELTLADGATRTVIARQPTPEFCRAGRDAAQEEYLIWSAMAERGLPVQKPLAVEVYDDAIDRPFFLVEYIHGQPELNPADGQDYARKYAEMLVRIHDADLNGLEFLPIQSTEFQIRPQPNEDLRESEVVRAMLTKPPTHANSKVLRHGDFWGGNILWQGNQIVGIIDWEECVIGDPLADLGITRLDLWWILGPEACDEFTRRYLELRPLVTADLPYWDLYAARRPMNNLETWAKSFAPLGRPDVTHSTMRSDLLAFIEVTLSNIR